MKVVCKTREHLAAVFQKCAAGLEGGPVQISYGRPKRTDEQNAKIQSMVRDIMHQMDWPGLGKDHRKWRHFLAACFNKQEAVEAIGGGLVFINTRTTSEFNKEECSEFIEFLYSVGADNDIVWRE